MTENKEKPAWAAKAAIAGVAVGSAALAAALLYAGRRKLPLRKNSPALKGPETD